MSALLSSCTSSSLTKPPPSRGRGDSTALQTQTPSGRGSPAATRHQKALTERKELHNSHFHSSLCNQGNCRVLQLQRPDTPHAAPETGHPVRGSRDPPPCGSREPQHAAVRTDTRNPGVMGQFGSEGTFKATWAKPPAASAEEAEQPQPYVV